MAQRAEPEVLVGWCSIPGSIEAAVRGLPDDALDRPSPESGLSIREQAHHLVEAQVVASSIVIAALGMPGCTYDWSWMLPFGPWNERLPYKTLPIDVSLTAVRALNAWVAAVVGRLPDGLSREVCLRDSPEAALRRVTVAEVLRQEVDHTAEHVAEILATTRG